MDELFLAVLQACACLTPPQPLDGPQCRPQSYIEALLKADGLDVKSQFIKTTPEVLSLHNRAAATTYTAVIMQL